MNDSYRQTNLEQETEKFEAFDQLTTALTHIDKYQASNEKELLNEAAESISKALKADKYYFKARYFEAVVRYLQDNHDKALEDFNRLLKSEPPPEVRSEIEYNIAVVNSDRGNFELAIKSFKNVIKEDTDPETKLLARAGLALTYGKQIELAETKTPDLDHEEIEKLNQEIKKTLASTQARLISADTTKEVKRIMAQALEQDVKFPPRRRRKRKRTRRWQLILWIAILMVFLFIIYMYLYYGLYHV